MSKPKGHHFIPKCYSKNFADSSEFLSIMDLWEDAKIFRQKPDVAFRKRYMYSQPVHAESRFDDAIEHLFSHEVESNWTPIFQKIEEGNSITLFDWGEIVKFISSLVVRVPIVFDAIVELLRENVIYAQENSGGNLPDELVEVYLARCTDKSRESVSFRDLVEGGVININIDPHRCITSMANLLKEIPIFQFGFPFGAPKFLHNMTDLPFISSDNPVSFFTSQSLEKISRPYGVQEERLLKFVFPISSRIAIVNRRFMNSRDEHIEVYDRNLIAKVNRITSRFSYRHIFANDRAFLAVGRKFKTVCPRPIYHGSYIRDGEVFKIVYKFGQVRPVLNSWKYNF